MDSFEQENGGESVVIVGGGIGGLATALALHRKGFENVTIYERSNSLRTEGTGLGIYANGWRALDQLGVGSVVLFDEDKVQNMPFPADEARCVKRRDLINALVNALPPNTIRFGHNLVDVEMDPRTGSPVLQFQDGNSVRAKAVIGCDGSNSIVANFLGLKPPTLYSGGAIRGLTYYPKGHSFPPLFRAVKRTKGDSITVSRIPIDTQFVYWFVAVPLSQIDGKFPEDRELSKQATLKIIKDYPNEEVEMVDKSELKLLSFTRLRYCHPWEILTSNFHKGSVTVLGDAMHVMCPFTGQGGSAALEDALVLARNLSQKVDILNHSKGGRVIISEKEIEKAFDQYVKERRMRIVRLTTQTYLIDVLLGRRSSLTKFIAVLMLLTLFRDPTRHTKYDCGKL
ncbi:OLC1v1015810C5 [Oldenlandia corymbosa var. corymbosa]|uniref:OLC1v1015810C5 n=1 Tax=Oldenlandia corymbosa var. corymbosa TaxID=529605 RepID=A0AAV1E659_OLDCO|nr:OLC1v1015810C5 [Oldenlandia corymbosa var. corymbosa]